MTFRTAEYSKSPDGAVRCRMLSKGRTGNTDLYFLLTRIGTNGLFFKWILQLLLMQNPHKPQASGGISTSGAGIPTHSTPVWTLLGYTELCSRPDQAHFCLQEVVLGKLISISGLNSLTWVSDEW